ncbi:MAG: c-type cytochrome [Dehalococcoidales bacterium]
MQKKILTGFILTLIIVIFIPVYWAMEPGRQEAALIRQQTEAVERGAETYSSACVNCHGAQGEGLVGPALKGTQLDDDTLVKIIARGVPGTTMSAWGVEDDGPFKAHQINDLVAFIKNWEGEAQSVISTDDTTTADKETTEAVIDGSKLFADRCSSCHGANREGTPGFAPPLTPESLSGLNDDEIREVITDGRPDSSMPPFNNILSPEEIESLIQFIENTLP